MANNESVNGDLISRSVLKEEYHKLPIQATAEVKCDDGVYRNRPLVDLALVCEMIENVSDYNDGWIPVEQRLPSKEEYAKSNGQFIVTDGNRTYAEWFDIYDTLTFGEPTINRFRTDKCAIAWKPLPPPYQPKGE